MAKRVVKMIQYVERDYKVVAELRDVLEAERGIKVSLAGASTEASKKLLDEKKGKKS